jgi:hypothetical protein
MVLANIGIVILLAVAIGVIIAVFQAPSSADALMILFIVGSIGAMFATWPIVLDQAVKAIVDAAECVSSPTDPPMSPVGGESVFSAWIGFWTLVFGIALAVPRASGSGSAPELTTAELARATVRELGERG